MTTLAQLIRAAAAIRQLGDPDLEPIARYLEDGAQGSLWQTATGYSEGLGARLDARDLSIRELGLPPATVHRVLQRYINRHGNAAAAPCPHREGSLEAALWKIIKLHPRPMERALSITTLARIIGHANLPHISRE